MKILTCCSVFVLLTLISFPITAEAFSRRHSSSELQQNQVQSAPHNPQSQTLDITPQAVPEPPVLLLMGIGLGLFAIYSMIRQFRGQKADRE
jgi:PEP-CTERM motif-containing protein